jgi:hypothetical protein
MSAADCGAGEDGQEEEVEEVEGKQDSYPTPEK